MRYKNYDVDSRQVAVAGCDGYNSDSRHAATETFSLAVASDNNIPSPTAPQFVSTPRTTLQLGRTYVYQAQAVDAMNEPVRYSLVTPYPSGLSVGSISGLVTWTPSAAQSGLSVVELYATNSSNLSTLQVLPLHVVSQMGNQPPKIVSTPRIGAAVGQVYQYNLSAVDPDHDLIGWHLDQGPAGMSLSSTLGTLAWVPQTNQTGTFAIVVRATDAQGAPAFQSFTITVAVANTAPIISSTPRTTGNVDIGYGYLVIANDADGDPLSYSLASAPTGMIIDPASGLVRWTPSAAGSFTVAVQVSDGHGASAEQQYQIVVSALPPERPPNITSSPTLYATVSHLYSYLVTACDPDGYSITFELRQYPAGMTITQTTDSNGDPAGLIQWTPTAANPDVPVIVAAVDSNGAVAAQGFHLDVRGNSAPYIVSQDVTSDVAPNTYAYDIRAFDPDGDPITYTLVSGPTGMTLDSNGRLRWATTTALISNTPYPVTVMVSDPFGAYTTHSFGVTIEAESTAPTVTVEADPARSAIGSDVEFIVHASDTVAVVSESLVITDEQGNSYQVALNAKGVGNLVLPHTGYYTATAYATNPVGLTGTGTESLSVYDSGDTNPPDAEITSPTSNQFITGPITIMGTATDSDFRFYDLTATEDVLNGGETGSSGGIIELAHSTTPVVNGVLGQFDPTLLPDSEYLIRLTAEDNSGNITVVQTWIQVTGNLKLGDFKVSFTDLTVPVAGIPITITRNYDTLNANTQGDFGYGWTIGYGTQLSVDLAPTDGTPFGSYTPMVDGSRVYVTMPDGTRDGYTFEPIAYTEVFQTYYEPYFAPDPGVTEALSIPDAQDVQLIDWDGQYVTIEDSGLNTFNPQDPVYGGVYTLTDLSGTVTTIDATTGEPVSIENRRGNELTFEADGIYSNTGRAVTFTRDSNGDITAITDPNGNSVLYTYDDAGNLVSVTDRMDDPPTIFTYRTDMPHYLDQIIDPFGRTGVTTDYNSDGRLDSLTDAQGAVIGLNFDTDPSETITDQNGNPASVAMDNAGNVTETTNQDGTITLMTYASGTPFLQSQTQVIGQPDSPNNGEHNDLTTTYTTDSNGLVLSETDPAGNTTRFTYDAYGDPLTSTDALGNTTTITYDPSTGNPLSITDPTGSQTLLQYDDQGDLIKTIADYQPSGTFGDDPANDPNAVVTTEQYDAYGDLTSTTNGQGVTTSYTYDADGNQTGSSTLWVDPNDPNHTVALATTNVFDANDQGTTSISPTGVTSTQYDVVGQAVSSTDETGGVSTSVYDSRGLVIQSTDPEGLITRTVYDAKGQAIYTDDPHLPGQATEGTHTIYDDAGNVVETDQLANLVINIVQQSDGSYETVLGSAGSVITTASTSFDSAGRVDASTDENGLQSQTIYGITGNVIETRRQSVDQNGNLVWLDAYTVYDSLGRTTLTTDEFVEGSSDPIYATQTVYDSLGREIATIRLKGVQVSVVNGQTVLSNSGTQLWETQTVYDSDGRVSRQIAADGEITDFEYDKFGQKTAEIGTPVSLADASLTPQQLGLGSGIGVTVRLRTEYVYDDYGHVLEQKANIYQVILADGTVQINRSAEQDTSYEYDALGKLLKTTYADGTCTSSTYDSLGRKISDTDQLGQTRSYQYDSEGQLISVTLPAVLNPATGQMQQPVYVYGYDAQGNQTLIQDPLGRQTTFTYDAQGNELTRTLPLGNNGSSAPGDWTESFQYDARGRVVLHISFEGVVTQYIYDSRTGNLSQENFYASMADYSNGQGTPSQVWTFTYDAFGRQVQVTQTPMGGTASITQYQYDGEGRVTSISSPQGVISYTYDNLGRKTATIIGTVANPLRIISYTYDALGRLQSVRDDLMPGAMNDTILVTNYQYNLQGYLVTTVSPNEVSDVDSYNNVNELTSVTEYAPGSNTTKVAEYDYTLRADGSDAGLTETFWTTAGTLTDTYAWTYDALDRLVSENLVSSDSSQDYQASYQYDLVGNRVNYTKLVSANPALDETVTSSYDANDRLLQEVSTLGTTTTYGYQHTEQTSQVVTNANGSSARTYFSYDLQGNMRTATVEQWSAVNVLQSREQLTYGYDTTGIRVSALDQIDINGDGTWDQQTLTEYLNDAQNLTGYSQVLRETYTDPTTGQVIKVIDYTWGLKGIAQTVMTYVNGQPTGTQSNVFGADGHGSVRVLTNMAGAIAQLYLYDAYGQLLAIYNGAHQLISGNAADALTTYLYSGQQFDWQIGMQYLRGRYYEPSMGRFTSIDPLAATYSDPLQQNRYGYAGANPINRIDPTGCDDGSFMSTMVGMSIRMGLSGMVFGGVFGAIRGGVDTALDPNASWSDVLSAVIRGGILGGVGGLIGGILLPWIIAGGPWASIPTLVGLGGWGLYNDGNGIAQSFSQGKWAQGLGRIGFGLLDIVLFFTSIQGSASAAANSSGLNPINNSLTAGQGVAVPPSILAFTALILRRLGIYSQYLPRGDAFFLRYDCGAAFIPVKAANGSLRGQLAFAKDVTWYEYLHELMHVVQFVSNRQKYMTRTTEDKEQFVFDALRSLFWKYLSPRQQADAEAQVESWNGHAW